MTSIFGVNLRSTMDLDATLKGIPLDIETITKIFNELINIDINDNMSFEIIDIKEIREEDLYGGYSVNLKVTFDRLWTHLMIDITTGDIITYKEIEFEYKALFDDENDLDAYKEKCEKIDLSRIFISWNKFCYYVRELNLIEIDRVNLEFLRESQFHYLSKLTALGLDLISLSVYSTSCRIYSKAGV